MAREVRAALGDLRAVRIGCLVFCLALVGMSGDRSETATSPDESPAHRWTRRTSPPSKGWIRESEAPSKPQRSPRMTVWEVTGYAPGTEPSEEQRQAAAELVERCYEAAKRHGWYDIEKGKADGFAQADRRHYRNAEFFFDDRVLDPDSPEHLMYYPMPDGKYELAGFMFVVRSRDDSGPQIGGPLTIWHHHVTATKDCYRGGVIQSRFPEDGECEGGYRSHRTLEMMHVWLIDHPQGPFATAMTISPDVVAKKVSVRKQERGF